MDSSTKSSRSKVLQITIIVLLIIILVLSGVTFILFRTLQSRVTPPKLSNLIPTPWRQKNTTSKPEGLKTYTLQYKEVPETNSNLLSLDIYTKDDMKNKPVIFFVHGGGLIAGDKANRSAIGTKPDYFVSQEFVFISTNYRLSPGVTHPAHITDVADALMYVYNTIERYGGNKNQIFVMGHSAGAHLVSLLSTNEIYIQAAGGQLDLIKGCVSLDTEQYNSADSNIIYRKTIGDNKEDLDDASPLKHVEKDKDIPPILTFYNEKRAERMQLQRPFIDALTENGIPAAAIMAQGDSHNEVNTDIGKEGDQKTQIIMEFLRDPQNVAQIAEKYNFVAT